MSKPLKTYYLVFEGKNTEPEYFLSLSKEYKEIVGYNLRFAKHKYTSTYELIEKGALPHVDDYDEVWAVFDQDGRNRRRGEEEQRKFREAFNLAKDHGIHIAFSAVCFEYWVSLHFSKHSFTDDFCEKFTEEKIIKAQPDFCEKLGISKPDDLKSKNVAPKLFAELKDKTPTAIRHAEQRLKDLNSFEDKAIYDINPYTNVHELVKKLIPLESDAPLR